MTAAEGRGAGPLVLAGPVGEEVRSAFEAWGHTVVVTGDVDSVVPDPGATGFVWLSPRAAPDEAVLDAVRAFAQSPSRRVGVAPHQAHTADGGAVPLGDRVIVADPKAARFSAVGPVPQRGAEVVRLPCTVHVSVPDRIGEHLEAINAETSCTARIAAVSGDDAKWFDLAMRPLIGTARGWLGSRGARGRAFSVAFLESFAPAAAAAKLWEQRHPDVEVGL